MRSGTTACRVAGVCALTVVIGVSPQAIAQPIRPLRTFDTSGNIKAIADGMVAITDETGKSWRMKISRREDGAVSLGGARVLVKSPATIKVTGTLEIESLAKGFPIRFKARLNRDGKVADEVAEVLWLDEGDFSAQIKTSKKKAERNGFMDCTISGDVESIRGNRMVVRVPRSRYARKGRLFVQLAKDAKVTVNSSDLVKVQPGDRVTKLQVIEFSTGELVIQSMEIQLGGHVSETAIASDANAAKYRNYSDDPAGPRPRRSQHFIVHTDMSERSARILLDKLETMTALLSRYYGRPQKGIIECYVIRDLKSWPPDMFPPNVMQKIKDKAGITLSQSLGRQTKSVVYACDKRGVAQHEAVHAYCNQTFGGAGPTWYAEGMAEMGQYWKKSQLAVDVDPVVIDYINQAKQAKKLKEIVAPDEITGDSWEAYSWRWALCHLLANNPNYNRNFIGLGISLMTDQPNVSFESVYGRVAKQLSFEYDQFVAHVGNGYRADLCAWHWNKRFVPVDKKGHQTIRVQAKAGWQPSSVHVKEGTAYEYTTKGTWKIDGVGEGVTAYGDNFEEAMKRPEVAGPGKNVENDVYKTMFLHMFAHNAPGRGDSAKVYFVSIGGADPSEQLLTRFKGRRPLVKRQSDCETRDGMVFDKTNGKRGILFTAAVVRWLSHEEVVVEAEDGTGSLVSSGARYLLKYMNGKWRVSASGGQGKLTGVIMKDYELSEPIPLGSRGTFIAPTEGNLYLRCGEEWTRLGDNSGTITVYIRLGK